MEQAEAQKAKDKKCNYFIKKLPIWGFFFVLVNHDF
jgi:hypothetical protein